MSRAAHAGAGTSPLGLPHRDSGARDHCRVAPTGPARRAGPRKKRRGVCLPQPSIPRVPRRVFTGAAIAGVIQVAPPASPIPTGRTAIQVSDFVHAQPQNPPRCVNPISSSRRYHRTAIPPCGIVAHLVRLTRGGIIAERGCELWWEPSLRSVIKMWESIPH